MTVNGEMLGGGRREIKTKITFHVETESKIGKRDPSPTWSTTAQFYDGAISCDAILGYGWLAQEKLDVLPWRNALQLHNPPRWILVGKQTLHPVENEMAIQEVEIDVSKLQNANKKTQKSGLCQNQMVQVMTKFWTEKFR